jgi:XRE family transcriptional regulator, regulator of sulfur utilization
VLDRLRFPTKTNMKRKNVPSPRKRAVKQKDENSGGREQPLGEAVRRLRDRGRLSVRALASKCGFSPSFISQVELNQASPSLASLERIAAGLGVTLGEFFHAAEGLGPVLVRSSDRPMLQSGWSRSQIESLGSSSPGNRLEVLLVTMRPEGTSGSRLHRNNSEMFVMVLTGFARLELEEGTQVLRRGDAITIPAGVAHRWASKGTKDVQLLKVSPR